MIRRRLYISDWVVDFFFLRDHKRRELVLQSLFDLGAPEDKIEQAASLLSDSVVNSGFTFSNPRIRKSIVVVGPTTSGREFQNTFVHELRHVVNDIARSKGIELDGEVPSYISGGAVMDLAEVVCELGCSHCRRSSLEDSVYYGTIGGIDL